MAMNAPRERQPILVSAVPVSMIAEGGEIAVIVRGFQSDNLHYGTNFEVAAQYSASRKDPIDLDRFFLFQNPSNGLSRFALPAGTNTCERQGALGGIFRLNLAGIVPIRHH